MCLAVYTDTYAQDCVQEAAAVLSRAGRRGGREHFKQTRASVDGGLRLERVHRAADNTRKMIFRLTVRTSLSPGHSDLGVDPWGLFDFW